MSNIQELKNAIYEINAEPSKWLEVAIKIEDAAKILQNKTSYKSHEIEHRFQEYMLWGFCIENLIKGILISDGKDEILKIKKGVKAYAGPMHNLLELAKKIDFTINIQEELLLKFLTNAILYLGRYPIPKNSSKLSAFWDESFDQGIEKIINRLKSNYTK